MQIFRLANVRIKIHHIPHVIFGTNSFTQNLHHSSVSLDITLLTCSSKTLYALDKRSPSKCKFSDFRLLVWKLTKFLMSFFKPRVSFPLNFASPFSANFAILLYPMHDAYFLWKFLAETLCALDKKSPSKYNFSDFGVL